MELTLTPNLRLQQSLGVSPMLIASTQVLALGGVELAEAVRRELDDNPALELVEHPPCPACGSPPGDLRECPRCAGGGPVLGEGPAVAVELTASLPAPVSDTGVLLAELRLALPASEHSIAEAVVASLDDRGYLTAAPAAVAGWLGVDLGRVERVLAELRSIGPAGIGARDLRECLLLQLDRLASGHELVRAVVSDHLEDLAAGRYGAVARAVGAEREEIVQVRDFIRQTLRPTPGLSGTQSVEAQRAPPDAIVEDREEWLLVRLTEPERFPLRLSPLYARLCDHGTADERRHASQHARSAREFATRLEQRWDTMRRVVQLAVEYQSEWVRRGGGPRRPLTRARLARELSLHESTVSRAVRERTMQLPAGRVVAISELFASGDERREALRLLLASEQRALTDAELVEALAVRGHILARRTVAKYRAQLGEARHTLR